MADLRAGKWRGRREGQRAGTGQAQHKHLRCAQLHAGQSFTIGSLNLNCFFMKIHCLCIVKVCRNNQAYIVFKVKKKIETVHQFQSCLQNILKLLPNLSSHRTLLTVQCIFPSRNLSGKGTFCVPCWAGHRTGQTAGASSAHARPESPCSCLLLPFPDLISTYFQTI